MKYLFSIFLAVVAICVVVNFASGSEGEYIIITSPNMGWVTNQWEQNIRSVLGEAHPRELDVDSPEAKVWIDLLGIEFIPYIVFDREIEQSPKFFELIRQGMIERKKDEYVIPDNILVPSGVKYFKREQKERQLDLFVMSHCPAGKDALFQIGNYLEKNPGAFKVVCHYITTFREFGIDSLYGPEEIKEDIRQLLIQKYYPDKFWEYLKMYREGKDFTSIIDAASYSALMQREDEGIALLEQDFKFCKELGINSSPTFLWENQIILRSIGAFRELMPKENIAALSHAVPLPAQGALATAETKPIPILVFYGARCPHCHWVLNEFIPQLEQEFGKRVAFEYYDVSIQENFEKKLRLEEEFAVVGAAIPEVFVAGRALVGEYEIKEGLRDILENLSAGQGALATTTMRHVNASASNGAPLAAQDAVATTLERFRSFTPFAIVGAGLLDGINPCAFSTIVFFLSFLVFAGFGRRQMLLVGLSFTIAVFLTYLGLGLGGFAGLERLRMFNLFSTYFDTAVGGLAIVLGIGSLYDYIYFKRTGQAKDMLLQLPRPIKNTIHKSIRIIKDKTSAGILKLLFIAFGLGVLVSLLESICTGQIYLPTLTFILKMKVAWWRAFLFLFLYNAMFILPLVIVLLLTLYGVSSQWWAKVIQRNLGKVKLVTALFFFGLGVFILLM